MAESAAALVGQLHDRLNEIQGAPAVEILHTGGHREFVTPDRQIAAHVEGALHSLDVLVERLETDYAQYLARKDANG